MTSTLDTMLDGGTKQPSAQEVLAFMVLYEAELRDAVSDLKEAIKDYDWGRVQDVVAWIEEALEEGARKR